MQTLSIHSLPVRNQRVLLRCDLNCPLSADGALLDDTRIRASLPTIRTLLHEGALRIIVLTHLGRPDGKPVPSLTVEPIRKRLEQLLEVPVALSPIPHSAQDLEKIESLPEQIILLENIRFEPGEENPQEDPELAQRLSQLGDCYINDAFGTAHRRHTSTVDLAHYFPQKAAAGLLMEKELAFLQPLVADPPHPFVVILAGSKVSTKVGVIRRLLHTADTICLGGAMAQTFLAAQGHQIGNATIESSAFGLCQELLAEAVSQNTTLLLPVDLTYEVPGAQQPRVEKVGSPIPHTWTPKDVGPLTVQLFAKTAQHAATVLWNGPLGVIEEPPFDRGTFQLAQALALCPGITIVGGGHTVAAVEKAGLESSLTHVSTGGGATLELLEQGTLPGIEALTMVS